MELISIIVPIYNIENYLPKCLDSILAQTYKNLEIILVDDGSTDNSGKICDQYASIESRIRVIHKENKGVSSARNLGLEIASGKYISFVDGDDQIELNMIERLFKNAKAYDCDISVCQIDRIDLAGRRILPPSHPSMMLDKEDIVKKWFENEFNYIKNVMYGPCNKIIKSSVAKSSFFREYSVGEDLLYIFELLQKCNTIYFDNWCGYHYIKRANSAMTSKFTIKKLDYVKAARQMEKICEESYPYATDSASVWVYKHVLAVVRQMIFENREKVYDQYIIQGKRYLKNNHHALAHLSFRKKIDYYAIMYCPIYIQLLLRAKNLLDNNK